MLTRQRYIQEINAKIAILRFEIEQCGKLGDTGLHKFSENFLKELLNIVYGFNLVNLNDSTSNYPGLDLSDFKKHLAFQVTSISKKDKIEDCLNKVLIHKLYKEFTRIKIFILGEKLKNYNILVNTKPHFEFDAKEDVMDFFDLLRDISNLDSARLNDTYCFLEQDLPIAIQQIKGEYFSKDSSNTVIDIDKSLGKSGFPFYHHWKSSIKLVGGNLSVPLLHQKLTEFNNNYFKNLRLSILSSQFKSRFSTTEVLYRKELIEVGINNHKKESALLLKPNYIQFEFAQYKSGSQLLTNMAEDFMPFLLLVYFASTLSNLPQTVIEVKGRILTNQDLVFIRQPNANPFSATASMESTYILNPKEKVFKKVLNDFSNETIMDLMQDILDGFCADTPLSRIPFMSIIRDEQEIVLNFIKEHTV